MVTYDSDRAVKYGFGVVRLAALTLLAFVLVHPRPRGPDSSIDAAPTMLDCVLGQSGTSWLLYRSSDYVVDASACGSLKDGWAAIPGWVLSQIDVSALLSYRSSHRWLGHVYIGSIGALVNVEALPFTANVLLLLLAGAFCLIDVQLFDYSSVVYLVKTFGGDFFAGKLDTAEWKLVLFGVFGILLPYSLMSELDPTDTVLAYRHILPLLMAVQFVCEYGDNHLEHWRFFRYRYSFELFTALILILLPLTAAELDVVLFDLVICTAYRLSNFLIQLCCGVYASQPLRKLLFYLYGYLANTRVINVTDPDLAVLVLQRSNVKGLGIERNLASPAWLPAMNVESVDGRVWEGMIANLHVLMRQLPPVSELTDIATRLADEVVAENTIIDANVIARLTLKMFLEYAMGLRWRDEFELFVTASWEWRKEIAVKGKADMNVKNRTVELVLRLIREASQEERSRMTKAQIASKFVTRSDGSAPKDLWVIFGENWKRPEYFSLLLQPFILSPCINTGDIMVALHLMPAGTPLETAIRAYHPFPLLERYVDTDIEFPPGSGRIAIPAHSQVVMMVPDFAQSSHWPVFGAGTRSCAGKHLALAFLRVFQATLVGSPNFRPEVNHRYSGRNNDATLSLNELDYFVKRISSVLLQQFVRSRYDKSEVEF